MTTLASLDPSLLEHATAEERAAYREALEVERALFSPIDYAARCLPNLKRYAHTELLSRHVVAHMNNALYKDGIGAPARWEPDPDDPSGEEGRWVNPETGEEPVDIFVVSAPPQHGKSFILAEATPAWAISRNPDMNIIITGYEANFAATFSQKNRDKIEAANIPGIELDPGTQAKDNWSLKGHSGRVISAGAGGPITGKGGHLIIIDDPVKNSEDALSEASRQKKWDWWLSTVKSRRRKGTKFIIIQTRWHEDDLAGRIIAREKSVYHINLPALAFEGNPDPVDGVARDPETGVRDPLGRKPGEALCPALHTRKTLLEAQEAADKDEDALALGGALWFSCLYQGKPVILGGGTLPGPYLRYKSDGPPSDRTYTLTTVDGDEKIVKSQDLYRFITVDLAISTKTRADWSVMSLWGWTLDGDLMLLDMDRRKMEAPDHEDKAREFWRYCIAAHGQPNFMAIEDKTFGTALIQNLVRNGGIIVRPCKADTDKETRALAQAGPLLRTGRIYFPNTPDADLFIKECRAFPNATHDDMVDTLSYAALMTPSLPRRRAPKKPEPVTADERMAAHLERLDKQAERKGVHPILGRW